MLFWLWGLKTLNYENGDPVRGQLFEPEDYTQGRGETYPQYNQYNSNPNSPP